MYSKTQLTAMSDSDLNRIATEEFGLDVTTDKVAKKNVVDAILVAQTPPAEVVVVTPESGDPVEEPPVQAPAGPKMFKIIIHNQEGPDASKFVKVQPNGIMYAIPREREVVVPEIVVNVLNDAVVTRMEYENGVLVERPARRHPFTVLGEVK